MNDRAKRGALAIMANDYQDDHDGAWFQSGESVGRAAKALIRAGTRNQSRARNVVSFALA